MGKELYDSGSRLKHVFEKSNEILDFDITSLMFHGPIEELSRTKNTQPAVFIVSMAYLMYWEIAYIMLKLLRVTVLVNIQPVWQPGFFHGRKV